MRIYLDDARATPSFYDERVYTCDEAIARLRKGGVEEISLDHDLGTDKTGYDVAAWIEEQAAFGNFHLVPRIIRVHSANPVGRERIAKAIESIKRLREKYA